MVKNLEAAKELVELYRSITIEQLKAVYNNLHEDGRDTGMDSVLYEITGFGSTKSCHLCKPISDNCMECIHGAKPECTDTCPCIDHYTYKDIEEADNVNELYKAIQARADYIESLINELENDN